ncbi:MAG TPA: nuclear transport factor 2 family protein [Xanthobacteraceae bacterium]
MRRRARIFDVVLRRLLLAGYLLVGLVAPAAAHPPGVADEDQAVAHEVEGLHEAILRAVRRKDGALLRKLYADSFTHTDSLGRVQTKEERIRAALAGEPMIEAAPVQELNYRVYGANAIVVTGKSPLSYARGRRTGQVRWLAVYVRTNSDWQLVASQATRVP